MLTGAALPATSVPMPGELTGSAYFTSWYVNWPALGLLVMIGALYVAGTVRFSRRDHERWPVNRTVSFLLGLALFFWLTMSFLATYQQVVFWARAVQIITLLMVVPLLLALGAPIALAVGGGPAWLARGVAKVLGSRIAALTTFPAVVSLVFLATPFTVYFSPLYEASLRSRGTAWVLSFALVAVGFFYYWTRLRLDPVPKEYPHLVSVWITFAEAIADGALGLTLMMGHHLVAGDWYTSLAQHRTWGQTPKQDQVWGGGALWLIGDLAGVPFIGALWRRMFHEDRERAAEVDAELDALDALEALGTRGAAARNSTASGVAESGSSGSETDSGTAPAPSGRSAEEEAQRSRPWWETDPVVGARMGFVERD
jgi:cytochrome c oxidase assembly factor CtaG